MSWEYRVVESSWNTYRIRRIFSSEPWLDHPVFEAEETSLDDLKQDIDAMRAACDKPVLEYHNGKLVEVENDLP